MKASYKHPDLEKVIKTTFGFDRVKSINNNICVFCNKKINPISEFKDEISRREFCISSICQSCQNKVFGNGEE